MSGDKPDRVPQQALGQVSSRDQCREIAKALLGIRKHSSRNAKESNRVSQNQNNVKRKQSSLLKVKKCAEGLPSAMSHKRNNHCQSSESRWWFQCSYPAHVAAAACWMEAGENGALFWIKNDTPSPLVMMWSSQQMGIDLDWFGVYTCLELFLFIVQQNPTSLSRKYESCNMEPHLVVDSPNLLHYLISAAGMTECAYDPFVLQLVIASIHGYNPDSWTTLFEQIL